MTQIRSPRNSGSLFADQPAHEFFACIAAVDQTWHTTPDRIANTLGYSEFSTYPTLGKYLASIQFRKGGAHELFIDVEEDGGASDPNVTVETLEQALEKKSSALFTSRYAG